MTAVLMFVVGAWASAWGLYSTVVARHPSRRAVAAVAGPVGVLLMAAGVVFLLVPGFFD